MVHKRAGHRRVMEYDEPTKARFWNQVAVAGPDDCWEWQGRIPDKSRHGGYGRFRIKRREHAAHRMAYQLERGDIPDGMMICHTCDNRPCVNPRHLYPGTQVDNMRDAKERGRLHNGRPNTTRIAAEARAIKQALDTGARVADVVTEFGVSRMTVYRIKRGEHHGL